MNSKQNGSLAEIISEKSSVEDHWKFFEEELQKFHQIFAELSGLFSEIV